MNSLEKNLRSRKFIITMVVIFATFIMAAAEKLGSPLSMVLLSSVASYSAANFVAGDNTDTLQKYLSRKFIITIVIIIGSCLYAYLAKNGLPATAGNVLMSCVASYNGFNALKAKYGNQ